MTKSNKEHTCTLCNLPIYKGSQYVYKRYAPWECHPDGDQGYFSYKAHIICDRVFHEDYDVEEWEYPDPQEFREYYLKGRSPNEEG